MSFFSCKVCNEKDKRIADLQDEISFLRAQAFPSNSHIPASNLEADGVLSGQQHVIEIPDEAQLAREHAERQSELERAERDRILSGSYDHPLS